MIILCFPQPIHDRDRDPFLIVPLPQSTMNLYRVEPSFVVCNVVTKGSSPVVDLVSEPALAGESALYIFKHRREPDA